MIFAQLEYYNSNDFATKQSVTVKIMTCNCVSNVYWSFSDYVLICWSVSDMPNYIVKSLSEWNVSTIFVQDCFVGRKFEF